MEALTGGREMDASAIREYFSPLEQWLKEDNEKHGEFIGWETGMCWVCGVCGKSDRKSMNGALCVFFV